MYGSRSPLYIAAYVQALQYCSSVCRFTTNMLHLWNGCRHIAV